MKKTYTFNCKVCGAEKSIPQSHKKRGGIYCSKACCAIGTRKSYTFNCKVCGAEKTVPRSFHANGCAVYCSKACCGIGKRKTYTFNCKVCGAEKSIPQREKNKGYGVYCSHACMGMSKRKDISGQIFNNLTVLKRDERDEQKGKSKWICLCTCGKEVSIRAVDLHSSHNKSCGSCGCVFKKHGTYKSAIYGSWGAMIQRCTNPKNSKYKYYGERGITVCDRWKSFENFLEDMGERPPGMTLDRIDNDKGYSKDNCRWATRNQQGHNRRYLKKRNSKYKGVRKIVRKNGCKWEALIKVEKKSHYLGTFQTEEEAALAYNEAAKKYYGDLDINKIED